MLNVVGKVVTSRRKMAIHLHGIVFAASAAAVELLLCYLKYYQ
jgi:hypothetical protein